MSDIGGKRRYKRRFRICCCRKSDYVTITAIFGLNSKEYHSDCGIDYMKKYIKLSVITLAVLAFIVVGCVLLDFVIYNYSYVSAIDVISQYARRIMVALSFSLIPSLLTKLIMLIADKCGKTKRADDTAAITKG